MGVRRQERRKKKGYLYNKSPDKKTVISLFLNLESENRGKGKESLKIRLSTKGKIEKNARGGGEKDHLRWIITSPLGMIADHRRK